MIRICTFCAYTDLYCLCKLKLVWMPVKVSKLYLEVNNLYNKRIFLYFCIILILFTCSGCAFFPDGSRYSGEQVTAEVVTENDNVTGKLGDNILVNADLKIPDVAVWNTYNASAKIYDEEKFINFLSDVNGIDIKDRREENKYYKFSDGSSVSFSSECLRYETVKSGEKHYNSLVSEYYGLAFDISDRFPLNELEGFSKEECIKTAGQVVETLGVETYGEPVIITMDADSSNRFLNTEGNEYLKYTNLKSEEGDGTWTKDDEVYFVEYQLSIDNIPISLQKVSSSTSSFAGSFIDIVIGKNGIMYIEGRGVNQYDGAQRIEGSLIDVNKAFDVLATSSKYMNKFTVDNAMVVSCELSYSTVGTSTLYKPYYKFLIKYTETTEKNGQVSQKNQVRYVFINAIDGSMTE